MDIDCNTFLRASVWKTVPEVEYLPECNDNEEGDERFIAATIPSLMKMLGGAASKIATEILCEVAFDPETKRLLLSSDAPEYAVDLMHRRETGNCEQVAVLLLKLCQDEDFRRLLLKGTLECVISFLGSSKTFCNEQVVDTLLMLSKDDEMCLPLADIGVIQLLIDLLREATEDVQRLAAAALWNLTKNGSTTHTILLDDTLLTVVNLLAKLHGDSKLDSAIDLPSSLPVFVHLLCEGNNEIKAHTIDLLYGIVRRSSVYNACQKMVSVGVLPPLVAHICEHGNVQPNAFSLLKLLHRMDRLAALSEGGIGALVSMVQTEMPTLLVAQELDSFLWSVRDNIPQVPFEQIDIITGLARSNVDDIRGHGVMALATLAREAANRSHILSTDAISAAVNILRVAEKKNYRQSASLITSLIADNGGSALVGSTDAISGLISAIGEASSYECVHVLKALSNIAHKSAANKATIVKKGGIQAMVIATRSSNASVRCCALFALTQLSIKSDKTKQKVAASGILPELVAILRSDTFSLISKALALLKSLAINNTIEKQIVAAGAIDPVIALVSGSSLTLAWLATGVLQNLAVAPRHKIAIAVAGGTDALLARLRGADEKLSIAALGALINLSLKCSGNRTSLIAKGVANDLVKILNENDGEKRFRTLSLLGELAKGTDNRNSIADAGAVSVLTKLIGTHKPYMIRKEALGALSALLGNLS